MKKILIVASSANSLEMKDGKKISTGYYLNELTVPAQYFIECGFSVVIATPKGEKPVLDDRSNDIAFFDNNESKYKAALKFITSHPSMQKPHTLKEVAENSKMYTAIFIPGGHAPMSDLIQDKNLGKILGEFHKEKKITSLLCHGPVALLSALPNILEFKKDLEKDLRTKAREVAKDWPYAGYNMTVFSNDEEKLAEKEMGSEVQFYVSDALTLAGGFVENGPVFKPFVVIDRELITGQNPASALELAKAVVNSIVERKVENKVDSPFVKYEPVEPTVNI